MDSGLQGQGHLSTPGSLDQEDLPQRPDNNQELGQAQSDNPFLPVNQDRQACHVNLHQQEL